MTNDKTRARLLVEELLGMEDVERQVVLAKLLAEDVGLHRDVRDRLERALRDDDFLRPPSEASVEAVAGAHFGEFVLLRELGRGGSSVVWLALQASLERQVAIKVLTKSPLLPRRTVDRFLREARDVARLNHRGIVSIHSVREDEHAAWFAMEYVENGDLAAQLALQRAGRESQLLPNVGTRGRWAAIVRLAIDIADALEHAHVHGLVHRDVKPRNILLHEGPRAVLADFGIALADDLGRETNAYEFVGTVFYMSPEQLQRDAIAVDRRTDVFSLGVVLYEMLTLTRPFSGATTEQTITRIQSWPPRPIRWRARGVPRDLERICMCALEKDPVDRYESAAAMSQDLVRFLDHEPVYARRPSPWRRLRALVWRRRVWAAAAAAFVVAALVTTFFVSRHQARRADERRIAPLVEVTGVRDWRGLSTQQLGAARTVLQRHRDLLRSSLGDDAVADIERRFEELRRRLRLEGLADLRSAGDASSPLDVDAVRLLRGARMLQRHDDLFPTSPLLGDDEALLPRARVEIFDANGAALTGAVSHVVLDARTGLPSERRVLGPLPAIDVAFPIGYGRFIVELDVGARLEFTRITTIDDNEVRVRHVWRPDAREGEDMVRIPARRVTYPEDGSPTPLDGREIALDEFLIDRCEVSNGDYRRFVQATNHRVPPLWSQVIAGSKHDQLPVVLVSWGDARDYAEWRGCRLASWAEWQLAARGPEMFLMPWSKDLTPYRGNTTRAKQVYQSREASFEQYFASAVAVDSMVAASSPFGLLHSLGNVGEWLESIPSTRVNAVWIPDVSLRIVAGSSWTARSQGVHLANFSIGNAAPQHLEITLGFRCARTVGR